MDLNSEVLTLARRRLTMQSSHPSGYAEVSCTDLLLVLAALALLPPASEGPHD